MNERSFEVIPLGGLMTLNPGERRTIRTAPTVRQYTPLALLGIESNFGAIWMESLMIGRASVSLWSHAKEVGTQIPASMPQLPISMSYLSTLGKELQRWSVMPGICVSVAVKNVTDQSVHLSLGFYGSFLLHSQQVPSAEDSTLPRSWILEQIEKARQLEWLFTMAEAEEKAVEACRGLLAGSPADYAARGLGTDGLPLGGKKTDGDEL